MHKLSVALLSLFIFFAAVFPSVTHAADNKDRVIVRFHPVISNVARDEIIKQFPVSKKENLRLANTVVLNVPKGQGDAIVKQLSKNNSVVFAEKDAVAKALDVPNDPDYLNQWGLQKILAPTAWNI